MCSAVNSFETVTVETELKRRHFEVEIDEDLMQILSQKAQQQGVALNQLVNEVLRETLRQAA
ncbi:hypothetical protein H6S82_26305 [Planktothrix sp. FACHB-1355]|uniref:Uncharacterized protein n=1 Tax=Aerosakkonema funiforme FACHB-1375 TaxID=2949571 RepID=A0A926ZIN5_9CYAN|nr:CopG family antitoxin [Aerosakkonema funiforme]MBD2183849.1 hypothetical protein [Aerosakkonema funiforme FACHB-1375]MBD3562323.1 hypothetical protein [Planktothrix sp. FACHB-1355]